MKNLFLGVLAFLTFGSVAAQDAGTKFGIKGGVQFTNFTGTSYFGYGWEGKTGFYVGGLVDIPISGNFHVQPELLYSMEGAEVSDSGTGTLDYGISYLRIPIMAKFYVIQGLSLQAGPEIAFKVATAEDYADASTNGLKSTDFGIGAGIGYELPIGLMFDLRYNLGLSNITDSTNNKIMNTGIQLGLGFRF